MSRLWGLMLAGLVCTFVFQGCLGSDDSMSAREEPDDPMAVEGNGDPAEAPADGEAPDKEADPAEEDPAELPVGVLVVTGEDAGDPVDLKFPAEFGVLNASLRPNSPSETDAIRITWIGRISHGGNLQYDERHSDGSVTVTARGLVSGWLLTVASKDGLAAAGVSVDRAGRRVVYNNAELTLIGGTSTIILNGILEY